MLQSSQEWTSQLITAKKQLQRSHESDSTGLSCYARYAVVNMLCMLNVKVDESPIREKLSKSSLVKEHGSTAYVGKFAS